MTFYRLAALALVLILLAFAICGALPASLSLVYRSVDAGRGVGYIGFKHDNPSASRYQIKHGIVYQMDACGSGLRFTVRLESLDYHHSYNPCGEPWG